MRERSTRHIYSSKISKNTEGGRKPSFLFVCLIFRLYKAVIAVFSLINYTGSFGLRIVEYVEGVPEQVHLHNCFLCRHRSIFKLLSFDNDVLFFLFAFVISDRCNGDLAVGNYALAQLLAELCLVLSATILSISYDWKYNEAYKKAEQTITDGSAYKKFIEFVTAQSGNNEMSIAPVSTKSLKIKADKNGYITSIDSRIVGESAVLLGAGRERKTDTIDYGAGIVLYKKTCDKVSIGDTIAVLYAETEERLKNAEKLFNTSYMIGDEKPKIKPLIYKTII